jgi:hypothetical protein
MRPFRRTPSAHTTSVSWATELVELAAVFFAVALAHLFVSLVGYHANGVAMLVISGAALLGGAIAHRWWAPRRHPDPAAGEGLSRVQDLLSVPASGRDLMRIRTTLPDRPGSLATLCAQLAALDVNILGIQIHPALGGAVDELLVATPPTVTTDEVTTAAEAGGGTWTTTTTADVHDLVDPATRALTLAADVVRDPGLLERAVTSLLPATSVTSRPPVNLHAATRLRGPAGRSLFLSRQSPPLTPTELSRAQAMIDLGTPASSRSVAEPESGESR